MQSNESQNAPAPARRSVKRLIKGVPFAVVVYLAVAIFIFPFLWVVVTSFKSATDVFQNPPRWVFTPTLDNYVEVLFKRELNFSGAFFNSLIVTVTSTAVSLAIGAMSAYSVARLPLPGKRAFSVFVLFLRMLPSIALMVPIYLLLQRADLLDTRTGLIIVYTGFNTPLVVWILMGFFADLPVEIEESGLIDGCSRLGTFLRLTLPLSTPGLAATACISALWIWNDFFISFIFTRRSAVTLIVLASRFQEEWGPRWGQIAATSVIAIAPAFLFALLLQRQIVRGLLGGALKG